MTLTFGSPKGGWPSFGSDGKRVRETPIVYLAGPMRGYAGCNFAAFDAAAERLRQLGWAVLSPAEHDREKYGDRLDCTVDCSDAEIGTFFDLEDAMAWDLNAIASANLMVVLPGWEQSRGVASEMAHAKKHGVPVLYYLKRGLWSGDGMRFVVEWA